MDCSKCRAAGETVTRGKDGRGRYAREIARERESRQSSADTLNLDSETSGTRHMAISPWARRTPDVPQEKLWNTPTRQKADEAWLVEHEGRMLYFDDKTSKPSPHTGRRESRRSSPRESYERVIEVTEVEDDFEEIDVFPLHTKTSNLLPYEIEEASRTPHRRGRKVSHDSEGSMPYYQESPMMKTPRRKTHFVPPISEHDPHEPHDAYRKSRRHGARTEPYYTNSCCFESPMTGSLPTHGSWTYHYEVVQPLQHDPYYPRTHPVY